MTRAPLFDRDFEGRAIIQNMFRRYFLLKSLIFISFMKFTNNFTSARSHPSCRYTLEHELESWSYQPMLQSLPLFE